MHLSYTCIHPIHDNGEVLYCIKYEDGDEEDTYGDECENAVDLYNKPEPAEVNAWELGNE